ncbi:MAG: FKBP-type peptidyl-prolyl cis-trans isomerase [Cellvibrionaceae bacterium]|nr:FKBP-type peptidyl-prolyl cis-trans isomerase [Cellvibrionaceae bacterium]
MKIKPLILALSASTLLAACGANDSSNTADAESTPVDTSDTSSLETIDQRLSYMVGTNVARQFQRDEITLDYSALKAGAEDIFNEAPLQLSDEQIQETISTMQARVQERQQEQLAEQQKVQAEMAEKNKIEGAAYLAENGKKDGVVTTDSGLQYRELVSGDGKQPKAEDTVSVHYRGTLINGTEFDSSYSRNEPATFPVQGVIPGWVEALQLMQVGDKWELVIPSDLAYGTGGTGSAIGPNAVLVFEVELLDVVAAETETKTED